MSPLRLQTWQPQLVASADSLASSNAEDLTFMSLSVVDFVIDHDRLVRPSCRPVLRFFVMFYLTDQSLGLIVLVLITIII